MKWSGVIAALMFAVAPIAAAQQPETTKSSTTSSGTITLHGCVRPGVDQGTVIVTDAQEVTEAGQSAVPAEAHGRKVIFWLDRDEALKRHLGQMVEITGTSGAVEKSEAEIKAGPQKDGSLVVEFEGPGKDVKASNADVGQAIGTAGRTTTEKSDVPTFLMRIKVDDVQEIGRTCR